VHEAEASMNDKMQDFKSIVMMKLAEALIVILLSPQPCVHVAFSIVAARPRKLHQAGAAAGGTANAP
jgi:hypothetical protein